MTKKKSTLDMFLNTDASKLELPTETIEFKRINKMFGGKKVEFTVSAISYSAFKHVQEVSTKRNSDELDWNEFQTNLIVEGLIDPSMRNTDLMNMFKVATPKELVDELFMPGEVTKLSERIVVLSGFDDEEEGIIDQAKN